MVAPEEKKKMYERSPYHKEKKGKRPHFSPLSANRKEKEEKQRREGEEAM